MARRASLFPTLLLFASLACERSSAPVPPEHANASTPASEPSIIDDFKLRVCEHARDRAVELNDLDWQLAEQDAPDDRKANTREYWEATAAAIVAKFVDVCVELESEGLGCMAEIDGYLDPVLAAKRASSQCRAQSSSGCEQRDADVRAAEAADRACYDLVRGAISEAWGRSRPESEQGGVVGVMAQDAGDFLSRPDASDEADEGAVDPGSDDGRPVEYAVNIRHGAATVRGPLDLDLVRRIVRAHLSELRSCYSASLAKNPSVAGEVTLEFRINAQGRVSVSKAVASDSFADPEVPDCMARAVKKWRFPKPRGGSPVEVSCPLILERST